MLKDNTPIFPSLSQFSLYLSEEKAISIDSSVKSSFLLIQKYFAEKEFCKENIRVFLNMLRTTKELRGVVLKTSTVNKYVRVIRLVASYMGISSIESFKGFRVREDETEHFGDLISDKEMRKICEISIKRKRDSRDINLRYRTALTFMRFSGIPPVDLCNLSWNMDKGTYFEFYRSKTGKHMIIPIVPEVRNLLDKLPHFPHNLVFGSSHGKLKGMTLNEEIQQRASLLGIKKHVTCYSFRYSMITWCYINGGEGLMPKIAKISGHTMNTAMKHYVQFDVQSLIDALYATHPGLIKRNSIDTIKRTIVNLINHLIDINKYEIDLRITPKLHNQRIIHLS